MEASPARERPWQDLGFSFGHCTIALQVAVILRRELRILILYAAIVTNIKRLHYLQLHVTITVTGQV
jgi:uncharacterized membrane protein